MSSAVEDEPLTATQESIIVFTSEVPTPPEKPVESSTIENLPAPAEPSQEAIDEVPIVTPTNISYEVEIVRVSIASDGSEMVDRTMRPDASPDAISANGRYIAFQSRSNTLVENDTNGGNEYSGSDVFLHDTETKTTIRVSVGDSGEQASGESYQPTISGDGRYVAFFSTGLHIESELRSGIFLYDQETQQISFIADGFLPRIALDGSSIVFVSVNDTLVADDTNMQQDIFVYEVASSEIKRVSLDDNGVESDGWSHFPRISADGTKIAYISAATNLIADDENNQEDIYVYDQRSGTIINHVSGRSSIEQFDMSANGRWIAYNNGGIIFLIDLETNEQVFSDAGATPSLSADGMLLAYAKEPFGIDFYNLSTLQTISVTENGRKPVFSADGNAILFEADGDNLVPNDTNDNYDIFVAYLSK